jgi:alpha-tubulin suppressor-like RCC1 family protein
MPNFYHYTQDGLKYSFDDVFVPAHAFRQGTLFTWGRNTLSSLGNNTTNTRSTPITTFAGGANWKQVSCGYHHSAAVKIDGTLWTWGYNANGQLGNNTTSTRNTPVTTFAGGNNWKQISCGHSFTSAIKTDGTIWTWGSNAYGQLGDNTIVARSTPVTTFAGGNNWKQVSCGGYHTAAIKTDGTLWSWGSNAGRIGDNTGNNRVTPVTTFAGGNNWTQVAGGNFHTVAIKTDGTLWIWGQNDIGQMGDDTLGTNRVTPVTTFAGGNNWKQVSCGINHTAAIKTDGTLWTWGLNSQGQLGTNTLGLGTNRITPVTTIAGGTNWKQVSCGTLFMAAVKTDGTLWTWGTNSYGQLGNNSGPPFEQQMISPITTFRGGTDWKQSACGGKHMAATTYIDDYQ